MVKLLHTCPLQAVTAALLVTSLSPAAPAQTPAPQWLSITTATVKPEMRQEFEGYMKQMSAAYKKSGKDMFLVFENVAGDLLEYTAVLPIAKFAELDGPPVIQKVLGEEGYANFMRNVSRCVVSVSRTYARTLPDLAIYRLPEPGPFFMATRYSISPGKAADFQNFLKNDYKPAMEKAGVMFMEVVASTFGSSVNEITTIRSMKSLGEIDSGPILNKIGADAAAALNTKSAAYSHVVSRTLQRARMDLSFVKGPA